MQSMGGACSTTVVLVDETCVTWLSAGEGSVEEREGEGEGERKEGVEGGREEGRGEGGRAAGEGREE